VKGPNCSIFDVLSATDYVVRVPRSSTGDRIVSIRRRISEVRTRQHCRQCRQCRSGCWRAADAAHDLDLRWVSALCYRNNVIEVSGVAAAVLNHPANGVAWLANKLAPFDVGLEPGEFYSWVVHERRGGPCRRHLSRRLRLVWLDHLPLRMSSVGSIVLNAPSEEHMMLRDLVKKFVRNELMPWRRTSSPASRRGSQPHLATGESEALQAVQGARPVGARRAGGGGRRNLPAVALVGVNEELGYTAVAVHLPA